MLHFMCEEACIIESGKEKMSQHTKRVQWHPACFAALNLEFMDNKHELEILQEQPII